MLRTAARPPLRLAPQDFEVHGSESVSRCSTVLLLDMSGSMERFSRFTAAKKVALALDALIRRLRDRLASLDPTHQYIATVRGHGIRLDNPPV